MSNIRIEKGSLENITDIAELFDLYRIFYGQESDIGLAIAFITDRLSKSESIIFLARDDDGRALGFTQLYPSFSSVSAQRIWVLNDLFVREEGRGKGAATSLMNTAKEFAIETQAIRIELATAFTNSNAQKLYESLGYQKDNEFYHYSLSV